MGGQCGGGRAVILLWSELIDNANRDVDRLFTMEEEYRGVAVDVVISVA